MINDSLHSMLITSYNTNQIKISIIVIIASFVRKDFNYLKKNIKPHVIANGLTNWGTITFWHPVPWSFIRRILECMVAISPELKTIKIARLFFFFKPNSYFFFFCRRELFHCFAIFEMHLSPPRARFFMGNKSEFIIKPRRRQRQGCISRFCE